MTDADPGPEFSERRARSRLDRLPASGLLSQALAVIRRPVPDIAAELGADRRRAQRWASGVAEPRPEDWRGLAAMLDAAAPLDRRARGLASACRRKAGGERGFSGKR